MCVALLRSLPWRQFYLPIMEPSFTSTIQVSVLNKNVAKDDLVATSFFDFNELRQIQVQ